MKSSRAKFLLFNILGLQLTWVACAYGAINGIHNLGMHVGLTYITLHFLFTKSRLIDLVVLLVIGSLGIIVNSVNAHFGAISFTETSNTYFMIPYWLMTLWFVFSLMIPHSLQWASKYLKFSFLLGAVGGSYSYWLGHKLGALHLSEPLSYSIALYFVEWGLIFTLALALTRFLLKMRNEFLSKSMIVSKYSNSTN